MQRLLTLTFVLILPAVSGCLLNGQRTWGGLRGDPCGCAGYSQPMSNCGTSSPYGSSMPYGPTVVPGISTGLPGPAGMIQSSPTTIPAMPRT